MIINKIKFTYKANGVFIQEEGFPTEFIAYQNIGAIITPSIVLKKNRYALTFKIECLSGKHKFYKTSIKPNYEITKKKGLFRFKTISTPTIPQELLDEKTKWISSVETLIYNFNQWK